MCQPKNHLKVGTKSGGDDFLERQGGGMISKQNITPFCAVCEKGGWKLINHCLFMCFYFSPLFKQQFAMGLVKFLYIDNPLK